jgi:hypothetical protein
MGVRVVTASRIVDKDNLNGLWSGSSLLASQLIE